MSLHAAMLARKKMAKDGSEEGCLATIWPRAALRRLPGLDLA
jgi:hypothetical protein